MPTEPITIVIADDHAVVRQGLRLLLEAEQDLAVVGESSDLAQTAELLRECTPAVVLLDLHMGRELSLSALFELRSASPATRVVILTMDDDPAFVGPAWNAGAAGYVLKEASRTDLVRAIRTVAKGGRYLDPALGGLLASDLLTRLERPPQQRLRATERMSNLAGAITCNLPEAVRGKRITLVDDVVTTGATVSACADTLAEAGAARVCALAFARDL